MPSKSDALAGMSVALLESRMSGEMCELVRRYGGVPRSAPSVRETTVDCRESVAEFVESLGRDATRVVIFLTGVGATVLFDEVERQGRLSFLLEALAKSTIVCRGPKPTAALKRRGLTPTLSAREPFTSEEVLEAMHHLDLAGAEAVIVHYGERNDSLASALCGRGARLNELCLYEWQLPEDTQPMKTLIEDVLEKRVGSVVFTSQIQGRHLLRIAEEMGVADALVAALNTGTIVAAVGPVCRTALESLGIMPHVVPDNPKMVPLVAALAEHVALRTTPTR